MHVPAEARRGCQNSWSYRGLSHPMWYWEMNLGSLKEQQALLSAKPFFQALVLFPFFLRFVYVFYVQECFVLQTHQKKASDPIIGGCWELNSSPLEEQLVFLTPDHLSAPPKLSLKTVTIHTRYFQTITDNLLYLHVFNLVSYSWVIYLAICSESQCLSFLTKSNMERRVYFTLQLVHHPGKSGQEHKTGADAETIEQCRSLACSSWITQLADSTQHHQPIGGTTHSEAGTCPTILNQDNVLKTSQQAN